MISNSSVRLDVNRQQTSLQTFAYTPYGYRPRQTVSLGFNGEHPDPITCRYLLGNGYRGFDPVLMRCISPDSMSPFRRGGVNSYAYCLCDPINLQDPSGHGPIRKLFSRMGKRISAGLGLNQVCKGSGKYFSLGSSEVVRTHVQKKPAAQVQSYPNPSSVPDGFDFVGFHGGKLAHAESLEAGVRLQYHGANEYGAGFYFSQAYDVASSYARGSGGHVFGVFVLGFKGLLAGEQLVDIGHGARSVREGYVIRESAFDKVIVRKEIGGTLVRRNSYRGPRSIL
ncbi:RHS repeat-associated core domain-containing protein [Pseudomonas sp. C5pp]|uniref:RHS repeat-associated core domain-containing protein n=1 Tax=Pseudomonas sp. C5pp TaxID=1586081 RepID=UPI001F269CD3|nr:RHS repeat-associated core domain-containing protein [Pseudomonas sp. C5pp]